MSKSYIAVLGYVDENTTEEVTTKEFALPAKDHLEAHKAALFKCNLSQGETVFFIKEASTRLVKFDYKKGFITAEK
jgi:hypothetical protein